MASGLYQIMEGMSMREQLSLVVSLADDASAQEHTRQMITKVREINPYGELLVVFLENPVGDVSSYFSSGASILLFPEQEPSAVLADPVLTLVEIIEANQPSLVLFPATPDGRAYAAETAVVLGGGLTADCIDISYSNHQYVFTRAAVNDSVLANICCINTQVNMCTIKKNTFQYRDFNRPEGETRYYKRVTSERSTQIRVESQKLLSQNASADISSSKLIFAFGRGIGGKSELALLEKLARAYGAGLAGTRAVVEEGLIEKQRQVGQSGISVSPKVYVAFGISGATQHMVGIKNADTLIVVNQDENAPIFQYADYGIVSDCKSILLKMNELCCDI